MMFQRGNRAVWTGILLLAGTFLLGQEPWPTCSDSDGDGYGDPASTACPQPLQDCNDADRTVFPGAPELCDGADNQCPGDAGHGQADESCMAQIPAGCFDMGDPFSEGGAEERPVHRVCLSAFEMNVHEVTNAEYATCVDAGVCDPPARTASYSRPAYFGNPVYDSYPVLYIDWNNARTYCQRLGQRLPTEAEWEYAARGGLEGKRYPWGDTITGADANFWNSGDPEDNDTNAVMSYPPNGYGLYDMCGNAWEWVHDWFDFVYYQLCGDQGVVQDPTGPANGTERVLRSGSYYYNCPFTIRVTRRRRNLPEDWGHNNLGYGFRCVRSTAAEVPGDGDAPGKEKP